MMMDVTMQMGEPGAVVLGLGRGCARVVRPCSTGQLKQWRSVRAERQEDFNKTADVAVVIVPGWLSDISQYSSTAAHLRSRGFATTVVPLRWYNWIPSLGGRSVRPILDRIDTTVSLALRDSSAEFQEQDQRRTPMLHGEQRLKYTFMDFLREFLNPTNGAQPPVQRSGEVEEHVSAVEGNLGSKTGYGEVDVPRRKVILVGHSAGGWICRILLGRKVAYDGKIYAGALRVKGLVTLGTPHICTDKLTKRNMDFVNSQYPGAAEKEAGVHYVCIAGKCARGVSKYGGLWKDFAYQSYELCCGSGGVWGDGVTPVQCAIALAGADHIILEGVEHFPPSNRDGGRQWYGSPAVVDAWIPALLKILEQRNADSSFGPDIRH